MTSSSWLLIVALIASMISGCASTGPAGSTAGVTPAMTANVAGTWTGIMGQGGFSSDILYELQQDGTKVSGRANAAAGGGGWVYLEGTVEGDTFTYRQARGACCGRLTVKGDEMTGYATTGYPVQIRRMK